MLKQLFLSIIFIPLLFISCSKDDEAKPEDPLANTVWEPSLTDPNPSSNPPGALFPDGPNSYFSWSNCNTDDSFTFQGGKISLNNGGTVCDTDGIVSMFNNQNYHYDQEKKVINLSFGTVVNVLELNDKNLKLGLNYTSEGEKLNLIFVFKRR